MAFDPVMAVAAAMVTAAPGMWAPPPPDAAADYQLGGAYPPAAGVTVVARDRRVEPAPGTYGICYVNGFQTQPEQRRWWLRHHADLLLRDSRGRLVEDRGWPGEYLLDTRTRSDRRGIARIVAGWARGCAAAGYRAMEPDNLDSWTRSRGLLTRAGAVDLARRITRAGHRAGLAVAQKNAAALVGRRIGFDFAVVEECQVYRECGRFLRVYGTAVIEIEYPRRGSRAAFDEACRLRGERISIVLRDRMLRPSGRPGHLFATC